MPILFQVTDDEKMEETTMRSRRRKNRQAEFL